MATCSSCFRPSLVGGHVSDAGTGDLVQTLGCDMGFCGVLHLLHVHDDDLGLYADSDSSSDSERANSFFAAMSSWHSDGLFVGDAGRRWYFLALSRCQPGVRHQCYIQLTSLSCSSVDMFAKDLLILSLPPGVQANRNMKSLRVEHDYILED